MQSAAEMPYFEGDFWPNILEESIKELEQEEEDKRKREEVEAATSAADVEELATEKEDTGEVWFLHFVYINNHQNHAGSIMYLGLSVCMCMHMSLWRQYFIDWRAEFHHIYSVGTWWSWRQRWTG